VASRPRQPLAAPPAGLHKKEPKALPTCRCQLQAAASLCQEHRSSLAHCGPEAGCSRAAPSTSHPAPSTSHLARPPQSHKCASASAASKGPTRYDHRPWPHLAVCEARVRPLPRVQLPHDHPEAAGRHTHNTTLIAAVLRRSSANPPWRGPHTSPDETVDLRLSPPGAACFGSHQQRQSLSPSAAERHAGGQIHPSSSSSARSSK
jgi:hypothetical protein